MGATFNRLIIDQDKYSQSEIESAINKFSVSFSLAIAHFETNFPIEYNDKSFVLNLYLDIKDKRVYVTFPNGEKKAW